MTRKNTTTAITKVRPVRVVVTTDDVAAEGERARQAMRDALRTTAAEVLGTIAAAKEYQTELLRTIRTAQGQTPASC